MLERIETIFDSEAPRSGGLVSLIASDYLAYYGSPTPARVKWNVWASRKGGSPRRLALLFLPRLLSNPCMHATLLLRLATHTPAPLISFWRTILIAKHSIDVQRDLEIGPGLLLPHPFGIGFGSGVRIGSNVTILNGAMLGGDTGLGGKQPRPGEPDVQLCPAIGDDVVIFARATLVGGINVGDRAVIGAGAWVDRDVRARAVQPGLAALYRKLAAK